MKGYGYSVWLIPRNAKRLVQLLDLVLGWTIPHTPHITVKTNFNNLAEAQRYARTLLKLTYRYEISGPLSVSENQHEHDPLAAWVFPASIDGLEIENSHLSVLYMKKGIECPIHEFMFSGIGDIAVVNTESLNPKYWIRCNY